MSVALEIRLVLVGVPVGDAILLRVQGVPGGHGQRLSAGVPVGDAILLGVGGVPGGMPRACPHTSRPLGDNYLIQSAHLTDWK